MFLYTDPGGTLKPASALTTYRGLLHAQYREHAKLAGSAFTLLEAFQEMSQGTSPQVDRVDWSAFPITAQVDNNTIDAQRFQFQDEYVEWRVERTPQGMVTAITFTTDFVEYYEALALVSHDALVAGIQAVIPGANPTAAELYGPNFNPAQASPESRAMRFRQFAFSPQGTPPGNPWNNGRQGILCLGQRFNTLGALFNLVGRGAIPKPNVNPAVICGTLGNFCGSSRNSDPSIATAVQNLARNNRGVSLADPIGVEIFQLAGIWRRNTTDIDINNLGANQGIWTITRSGRRAVLTVPAGLTVDGEAITSGAQVANRLRVWATVVSAREQDLPEWARIGQEHSARLEQEAAAGGVS
jgi:hypothetical protein